MGCGLPAALSSLPPGLCIGQLTIWPPASPLVSKREEATETAKMEVTVFL